MIPVIEHAIEALSRHGMQAASECLRWDAFRVAGTAVQHPDTANQLLSLLA